MTGNTALSATVPNVQSVQFAHSLAESPEQPSVTQTRTSLNQLSNTYFNPLTASLKPAKPDLAQKADLNNQIILTQELKLIT